MWPKATLRVKEVDRMDNTKCEKCGYVFDVDEQFDDRFCPNCGEAI